MGWDVSNLDVEFVSTLLFYSGANRTEKVLLISRQAVVHLLLQANPNVLLLEVDTSHKADDLPFCLCLSFELLNVLVVFTKVREKLISTFSVFEGLGD